VSETPPRTRTGPGLFGRIYSTFVATVLVFVAAAGAGTWAIASSYDADWVAGIVDGIARHEEEIRSSRYDVEARRALRERLETELGAQVEIFERRDANPPPEPAEAARPDGRLPLLDRRERRMLKHGHPVLHRRGPFRPPVVIWRVGPADGEGSGSIVVVDTPGSKRAWVGLSLLLGLTVLGAGAFALARPLARRLARLEASTHRFAQGDLEHRASVSAGAMRDEIDQLAAAFNEMADEIGTLVAGQRTLLANVSHELRTPIARMRVLTEILRERVDVDGRPDDPAVQRLARGLDEMEADLAEVETLIGDLLTSGRLELGRQAGLTPEPLELAPLLEALARRFAAAWRCDPPHLELRADRLLIERLLINLLGNARRACPEGGIELAAAATASAIVLSVEDEGPGIPPADRERVFQPFARLDPARDRDRGGVGLGLHLCRQIARAHGGDVHAEGRADGRAGARLVVRLPPG
jgi:signal transduction histidine kinase